MLKVVFLWVRERQTVFKESWVGMRIPFSIAANWKAWSLANKKKLGIFFKAKKEKRTNKTTNQRMTTWHLNIKNRCV